MATSDTAIIIPAYNEQVKIAAVVARARTALAGAAVVVINDGSTDQTARAAAEAGAIVISLPFNMGYGAAIQTGYKYALTKGYRFIVQMDGDGQHDAAYAADLLAPIVEGTADFVVGSRFLVPESYVPSVTRRAGMYLFRYLVSAIIRQPITDTTSGFQAFNRDVVRFFSTDAFPCDYPDADMLIMLHRAGFRIAEVPVRMAASDGKSMHSGLKPLYYVFKMLLSIFVTLLRQQPPAVARERSR